MRKLTVLSLVLSLAAFSCKKETHTEITTPQNDTTATIAQTDSVAESPQPVAESKKDSLINNAPLTKKVLKEGVARDLKEDAIHREADAAQLPFKVGEVFEKENQTLVFTLKNVPAGPLSAKLETQQPMNIRISTVEFENGKTDGPFGREMKVNNPKKGNVKITVTASNMASGKTTGDFSLSFK